MVGLKAMGFSLMLSLVLIFYMFVLVAVSMSTVDATPKGFAVLGSFLPDDAKHWVDVRRVIETHRLKKYEPEELKSKEKLGVTITEDDGRKGFIVFSRHYLDPVYEFSLPNNRTQELSLFASLGEYEPTSFSVYALKDLELTLSHTDLTGRGGTIGRQNVDIRVVTPSPFVYRDGYWMEPKFLEKKEFVRVPAGTARQFWVTVYVPEIAKPGDYKGQVKLSIKGGEKAKIAITVKVLPIKLMEPDILYLMCFLIPNHPDLHPENLDKYFVDMKEHGMNSIGTWPDAGVRKDGERILFDFSQFGFCRQADKYFAHSLDRMMEGYRKAGFNRFWVCGSMDPIREVIEVNLGYKWYTPDFDKAYLSAVEQLLRHAKKKNWPPFCLHLIDEPAAHEWAMKYAEYYYRLVKEKFPQVKTMANVFGTETNDDERLAPFVDILAYNAAVPELVERCKKWGKEYWLINHGSWGRDPKLDRLTWGLFTLKSGAKAMQQWVYTWWWEMELPTPGKYLHPSFKYIQPAPDGPIPTLAWEAVREGIDDVKYAHTLIQLIKKAKSSGKPQLVRQAEQAEKELNEILATIPQFRWLSLPPGKDQRELYMEKNPSETFDANRWKIAQSIIRLGR